jgi:hypothetical protein
MRPSLLARALFLSSAVLSIASCGGGDDFLTGQPDKLQIQGTVDGMAIDLTEPNAGGGITQVDSGEFDYGGSFAPVGTGTAIKLTWPQGVADGQVTAASGTFTLGSGPTAGQPFCAGSGTVVKIESAGFQFNMTGLASGTACDQPHTGTLRGWFALSNP